MLFLDATTQMFSGRYSWLLSEFGFDVNLEADTDVKLCENAAWFK